MARTELIRNRTYFYGTDAPGVVLKGLQGVSRAIRDILQTGDGRPVQVEVRLVTDEELEALEEGIAHPDDIPEELQS